MHRIADIQKLFTYRIPCLSAQFQKNVNDKIIINIIGVSHITKKTTYLKAFARCVCLI